jgi:hypothetical protein
MGVLPRIHGLLYRNVGSEAVIDSVRRVSHGEHVIHQVKLTGNTLLGDSAAMRVRDSLSLKEMRVAALIF